LGFVATHLGWVIKAFALRYLLFAAVLPFATRYSLLAAVFGFADLTICRKLRHIPRNASNMAALTAMFLSCAKCDLRISFAPSLPRAMTASLRTSKFLSASNP
jgi:hypothetical protein